MEQEQQQQPQPSCSNSSRETAFHLLPPSDSFLFQPQQHQHFCSAPAASYPPPLQQHFGCFSSDPRPPPPHAILPSLPSEDAPPPPPLPVIKRKRGRPRKYASSDGSHPPISKSPVKAATRKALLHPLGVIGRGFTPHVLSIAPGEDVEEKILNFFQHGPWAVCILSANGVISNASLRHGGIASGAVHYEGRFQVLSLSGISVLAENGQRTGSLSVSLAGPDGRAIGGRVAGSLKAASPVQVILGTFLSENYKGQSRAACEGGASPHMVVASGDTRDEGVTMEQMHSDAKTMEEIEQFAESDKDVHHVPHVIPFQTTSHWGASHYSVESRGQNEQMQPTHGR